MVSGSERSDLPLVISELLNGFEEYGTHKLELAIMSLQGLSDELLGGEPESKRVIVAFEEQEYELFLKRNLEVRSIQFVIQPKTPAWSKSDIWFTLNEDNTVFDSFEEEVEEVDGIEKYIEAVNYLKRRTIPAQ